MKLSAAQERQAHHHYMADAMKRVDWDLHHAVFSGGRIPPEWHEIAKAPPRPIRERMHLLIDQDVARFFRSMGRKPGERMNEVLRAFMHARLAGLLQGAETVSYFRDPEPKPGWTTPESEAAEDAWIEAELARFRAEDADGVAREPTPKPVVRAERVTFAERLAEYAAISPDRAEAVKRVWG